MVTLILKDSDRVIKLKVPKLVIETALELLSFSLNFLVLKALNKETHL